MSRASQEVFLSRLRVFMVAAALFTLVVGVFNVLTGVLGGVTLSVLCFAAAAISSVGAYQVSRLDTDRREGR